MFKVNRQKTNDMLCRSLVSEYTLFYGLTCPTNSRHVVKSRMNSRKTLLAASSFSSRRTYSSGRRSSSSSPFAAFSILIAKSGNSRSKKNFCADSLISTMLFNTDLLTVPKQLVYYGHSTLAAKWICLITSLRRSCSLPS